MRTGESVSGTVIMPRTVLNRCGASASVNGGSAAIPACDDDRKRAGEKHTLRVNRLVKVPRLLYPTLYAISVTLSEVLSSNCLARYNRIAARNLPGDVPVTDLK